MTRTEALELRTEADNMYAASIAFASDAIDLMESAGRTRAQVHEAFAEYDKQRKSTKSKQAN